MSPAATSLSSKLLSTLSTEFCMDSKQCRNYARNHDVHLTVRGIRSLINLISHHDFIRASVEPVQVNKIVSEGRFYQDDSICVSTCSHPETNSLKAIGHLDTSTCLNVCSVMKTIPC